jgi:lipopolysaccharide biosynthesis regulator YciM
MYDTDKATAEYDAQQLAVQHDLASRFDTSSKLVAKKYEDSNLIYVEVSPVDVNDLYSEVARAKAHRDSYSAVATRQTNMIESVKEYLLDNYDELESHADEIASLLDIELTREVEYSVTMTATVTVTVAPGDDAESIISDNLYIESNSGSISVDDYEVDYSNES